MYSNLTREIFKIRRKKKLRLTSAGCQSCISINIFFKDSISEQLFLLTLLSFSCIWEQISVANENGPDAALINGKASPCLWRCRSSQSLLRDVSVHSFCKWKTFPLPVAEPNGRKNEELTNSSPISLFAQYILERGTWTSFFPVSNNRRNKRENGEETLRTPMSGINRQKCSFAWCFATLHLLAKLSLCNASPQLARLLSSSENQPVDPSLACPKCVKYPALLCFAFHGKLVTRNKYEEKLGAGKILRGVN